MFFILNVIIARQKFSAHLIYLSFSKFSYRQNMFWSRNLSSNMSKITSFSLKNRRNHPVLGALFPDPLCLRRPGGGGPPPPPTTFALSQYKFFNINAAFTWHKEKDGNIILISKTAVAVVTDNIYCKLWCHTLWMTF